MSFLPRLDFTAGELGIFMRTKEPRLGSLLPRLNLGSGGYRVTHIPYLSDTHEKECPKRSVLPK